MSEPADDPEPIPPDDLSDDPESRLLRRYRQARLRGDDQAALELWEQLVLGNFDLMRTKIARLATRHEYRWTSAAEVDDIVQEAYLRAMTMALRFDRDTRGQLRAALIKTAEYTARDYERRLDVRKRDVAGSIDQTREHEDGGEYKPWEAKTASGDWTSEQALGRIGAQQILDAIAMIPNENQRAVIGLTWAGYDSKTVPRGSSSPWPTSTNCASADSPSSKTC